MLMLALWRAQRSGSIIFCIRFFHVSKLINGGFVFRKLFLVCFMLIITSGCSSTPETESDRAYLNSNYLKAEQILFKAALKGDYRYISKLGDFYLRADNPLASTQKAVKYHVIAAEGGNLNSIGWLSLNHPDDNDKMKWVSIGARWNLGSSIARYKKLGLEPPEPDLYNKAKQNLRNEQRELDRIHKRKKTMDSLSTLNKIRKLF